MAITWRNIGQSSNTGNSLIAGASDTISEGLNSLRGAAREYSAGQIDQYNTGAERNTADILNRVQNSEDPSQINLAALTSEFGKQFDASAVTQSIGDRTNALRQIAREDTQDQLAQDKFGLAQEQLALDTTRTNADINRTNFLTQTAKDEQATIDNINAFTTDVLGSLGEYDSATELRASALNQAEERGIPLAEATQAADQLVQQWGSTIGSFEMKPVFEGLIAQGQAQADTSAQELQRSLDIQARDMGLNPVLIGISQNQDIDFAETRAYFNEQAKESESSWDWTDDGTVDPLIDMFTRITGATPSGAELNYFASLAQSSGSLDSDDVENKIKEYSEMLKDKAGMEWYRTKTQQLNQAKLEYANNAAKKLRELSKKSILQNQERFNRDPDPRNSVSDSDFDFRQFIPKTLQSKAWLSEDAPEKKAKNVPKRFNPNTNTFE